MAMRYVAAYLLKAIANEDGSTPTEKDVRHILDAGGISIDDEMLKAFLAQVEGKDICALIAEGRKNLETFGGGGAAPAAAGAAAAGGVAPAAAVEVVEEEEEEEEADFDLFG